jgi:hypothetical protein
LRRTRRGCAADPGGTIALIVALGSVIGFAAGLVALLSRLIGPDQH